MEGKRKRGKREMEIEGKMVATDNNHFCINHPLLSNTH